MLRYCAALLAALLCLPALAAGQPTIKTVGGEPLLEVTDPARALPVAKTARPATAGLQVYAEAEKDGQALVVEAHPSPPGTEPRKFTIPTAALRKLPGKTWTAPPAWLPKPAVPDVAARDVVAFEQDGFIVLTGGQDKPTRLERGQEPAVAPDASLLVFSPDTRIGIKLVDLTSPARSIRFFPTATPIKEKCFSPDGSRMAWRTDSRIEIYDPRAPMDRPRQIVAGLSNEQTLQGFTADGAALVVQDMQHVTWFGLDGRQLRQEPIATFTDDPWGSSADHYLPSPSKPDLMLVGRDTIPTPAFSKWAHDSGAALYIFDAASGTNFRLTPKTLAAVAPAWSPDGRRIYFAGLPETPAGGDHRIYRVNADGSGLTEIARGLRPSVATRR